MAKLIAGPTTYGDTHGGSNNYCLATLRPALFTGIVRQLWVHITDTNSNIKAAIYANNAGACGTQLWVNNTGIAGVVGWNVFTVSSIKFVLGTSYWLAINTAVSSSYTYLTTGTSRYAARDYASVGCPADASGLAPLDRALSIQAWGTPVVRSNIISF